MSIEIKCDAPANNLPSWDECYRRVDNTKYIEDNNLWDDDFYLDVDVANPLHEFIYEYDDSDPCKSAWFLHRLEKLIEFVREQKLI